AMAAAAAGAPVEARPELVGKRFLCVSGEAPPDLAEIAHWPWRVGVIRAVSHRDTDNPELTVRPRGALLITRLETGPGHIGVYCPDGGIRSPGLSAGRRRRRTKGRARDSTLLSSERGEAFVVYVEFDDLEWEKREWVKVYEDFQIFFLEQQLVWAKRKESSQLQGTRAKQIQWPALVSEIHH
ncbi:hypothetical protein QTP70_031081, partial [Hemibagrus guttatus]